MTDLAAAIATFAGAQQIFHYTAYGQMLGIQAANAATTLLYSGEQFDARIGRQYLRARYYDPIAGTFNRLDPFFGKVQDPQGLHKYLYTQGDPINLVDPSGRIGLGGIAIGVIIGLPVAATIAVLYYAWVFRGQRSYSTLLRIQYLEAMLNARQFYRSVDPELYSIMNLDTLFDELEFASKGVLSILHDPERLNRIGASAAYNRTYQTMVTVHGLGLRFARIENCATFPVCRMRSRMS